MKHTRVECGVGPRTEVAVAFGDGDDDDEDRAPSEAEDSRYDIRFKSKYDSEGG